MTDMESLPRPELVRLYTDLLNDDVPKGMSTPLLQRIISYEQQAAIHGGLSANARKQLKSVATGDDTIKPSRSLKAGARLVREWNGVSHVVDVTSDGFIYCDRSWRSLSAIARDITGAKWSGPRFFGLQASK